MEFKNVNFVFLKNRLISTMLWRFVLTNNYLLLFLLLLLLLLSLLLLLLLEFTPCKSEQQLRGIELHEKEAQNHYNI